MTLSLLMNLFILDISLSIINTLNIIEVYKLIDF